MNKYTLVTLIAATIITGACGVKRYEQPARCDDLSMSFYDETNPAMLSEEQKGAVSRFASLQGNWAVTFSCIDQDSIGANLLITEALPSNVELYEWTENAECNSYGKAVFEARVTNTGDLDLDDTNFIMTADLMIQDEHGGNYLEAQSTTFTSQDADIQSFNLRIAIHEDGDFAATKEVTVFSDSNNGSMLVTRRNECFLTDWVSL